MTFTLKVVHPGRLDKLSVDSLARSFFQKLIKKGEVKVNNAVVKIPHYTVKPNDVVTIPGKGEEEGENEAAVAHPALQKFFEDKALMVINKPSGINVERIISPRSRASLFLAHRLDKNTSGILVIAKGEKNLSALQNQWKLRKVKKKYLTLLQGILTPRRGSIEAPISRSIKTRTRMAVSALPNAREASTEYKVIQYFKKESASLVEAYPFTGRTHQIRVHFASIGHPILGDTTYGSPKLNKKFEQEYGLSRQFLHAAELSLKNPQTKKRMTFRSKLPKDLEEVLDKLGR